MISIDQNFNFPMYATGRLVIGGKRDHGTLRELLPIYEALSARDKKKALIMLDHRLVLPVVGLPRRDRTNLYDGEISTLLPYFHAALAKDMKDRGADD